jgi:hypothetical protein
VNLKFAPPRRILPVLVALLTSAVSALAQPPAPDTIEFNRDIRPILSDTCYLCHGPDKARRKADLRFDVEVSAKAKIEDHFAIVPGKPAESELIRRISTSDADDHMPPAKAARQLTPQIRSAHATRVLPNVRLQFSSHQIYDKHQSG